MARVIRIKWTQRNIDRLARWFRIEFNWNGSFKWARGVGYKVARDGRFLTFVFMGGVK
jgi:hypothetical protein